MEAAAHDPLTLISQPSPPIVVPAPLMVPPPAVPAPQQGTADGQGPAAGEASPVIGDASATGATGGDGTQPQPPGITQPEPAQAAVEPAGSGAAAVGGQEMEPATSVIEPPQGQATDAQPSVRQVVPSAQLQTPQAQADQPAQPAPLAGSAAVSVSTAQAAPDKSVEEANASNVTTIGNGSAAAAAAAGKSTLQVPQAVLEKQSAPEAKLAALDADDKQFQLQLQSSRLGKSVYDLLVQVGLFQSVSSLLQCPHNCKHNEQEVAFWLPSAARCCRPSDPRGVRCVLQ